MFFSQYLKPFLIVTGLGTAGVFVYALFPAWATETLGKIPAVGTDVVIVRHWGVMVGLMGLFMVGAAFKPEWRSSILLYSAVEKAFMVYLNIIDWNQPYTTGFHVAAIMDGIVVLWIIAYWIEQHHHRKIAHNS